ncbi:MULTISPECIES: hypothetical protein [Flavobacterium]|uniref:hypothetical protein n=1 Tax=Flavobacterium TaxID=237 RepID=UPI002115AD3C|nr:MULTISPECIES: hypothetical protein [Flavobacterium]UUF16418.1 hypothetical protein NLJ00_09915 [Flavobacterium panici]
MLFIKESRRFFYIKKTYIVIIFFFFSLCSLIAQEKEKDPVNVYLNSKLKNNDTIIVIENKLNNNYAIDLLKERSIAVVTNNTNENSVGLKPPLYTEENWSAMNQKYRLKNTDEIWLKNTFWNQNDFKNVKIKFIKEDVFPKPFLFNEYMTEKKNEVIVFSFSEPIFYKNSEYVIFAKSETTTKKQFIQPNSIVVMKKENGKWILFQEIYDGNYY